LAGIVIRDTYTDRTEFYTVVTTDLAAEPEQIHEWMRSRWAIEETFGREPLRFSRLCWLLQTRRGLCYSALQLPCLYPA